jgi:hypothetical protein
MGALSHDRIDVVRALIETAPDSAVRQLEAALKGDAAGQGLAAVRAVIDAEVWDRAVRDCVFAPLVPLCARRADGFEQVQFPITVLPRLWRALKQAAPTPMTIALANLTAGADRENVPPSYDQLCREAVGGLERGDPAFAPVTDLLEAFRPGAAAQFAGYLAITSLARAAVARLPAWIRNMNGDHAASVRLVFKDAGLIAEDAGPRLVEIMQGHLREPWMLMRVISAVTQRASDRYVSSSEMAFFCERVLADIDAHLNAVRLFEVDGGPEAGAAAAGDVGVVVDELAEFESALELDKEGVWGKRLGRQRSVLANLAEGYLKKCGKLASDALPTQPVRVGGVIIRTEPRLTDPPEPRLVRRAMAGLTFFDAVRACAPQGGYGTVRAKACEEITAGLDSYLEDILAMLHGKEVADPQIAHAYMAILADFMGLAQDHKAGQIVRRRAAAAV